jgi:signal transduction protein with GAF and PtsI domain
MTLDTLCQVLKTECCWVQTINVRDRALSLVAQRGFSAEMKLEMASLDINHRFSEQTVGLGNEIIIPDLSNDGLYGLSSFRRAGFKWLVAAPLMTYRVHGVLGIASLKKKHFGKETAELTRVIAGLIGTALNKSWLSQKSRSPDKSARPATKETPSAPSPSDVPESPQEGAFHKHARKMKSFRNSHR